MAEAEERRPTRASRETPEEPPPEPEPDQPRSLSEEGIEATMEAYRRAHPASTLTDAELRANSIKDIENQKEQMRLAREWLEHIRREGETK